MTGRAAPTWGTVLGRLDAGEDLDADVTRWAVEQVMSGQADPEDVKAFLLALQAKGATADEVAGAAEAMRVRKAVGTDGQGCPRLANVRSHLHVRICMCASAYCACEIGSKIKQ